MLARNTRRLIADFDTTADRVTGRWRGNRTADRVFYTASALGDHGLIWVVLGAVRGLRSEHDVAAAVRVGAGVAIESVLVNIVIKSFFRRSRPPWEVERPHHLRRPRSSSFPSGHATSAFTSAVLLSEGDDLWPAYYALAVVVASSRVYVRIHHASDVLAGAVMGLAFGHIGRRLAPLPVRPVDSHF
ncbi:MAG TPA: phosphatase PAP2 family protein [Acidimicrobiales bacterium]|nr:phosphatase PAP2 family protein [Acidimicrobiales bacterium]